MTTTTIRYFPDLHNYTRHTIKRGGNTMDIADFIYEWKFDDDPREYFELKDNPGGYYRVNYHIINYLLINHQDLFPNKTDTDTSMSPLSTVSLSRWALKTPARPARPARPGKHRKTGKALKAERGPQGSRGSRGSRGLRGLRGVSASTLALVAKTPTEAMELGWKSSKKDKEAYGRMKTEFLNYIRDNIFKEQTYKVKKYNDYMKEKNRNIHEFILGQFQLIRLLYNALAKKLPTCKDVIDISFKGRKRERVREETLVLYRGFNYQGSRKMIENIKEGDEITTVSFLSASVQEMVAIKFISSEDKLQENQILWKIIISDKMLAIFNYSFISSPFHIRDSLYSLVADGNVECEFLLNMGARLRCVSIRKVDNFKGVVIGGIYTISKKKYVEYTFEFIGWDTEYTRRINRGLSKYIEVLKTSF